MTDFFHQHPITCTDCGGKLRVYQPEGQHPTIYCPKCESPWGVHCRDAREEDITDLLEWFAEKDEAEQSLRSRHQENEYFRSGMERVIDGIEITPQIPTFGCSFCGDAGPVQFTAEDLPIGPRDFCSEKCYALFTNIPIKPEGYYGFVKGDSP